MNITLTAFIDNLIRNNATYGNDGYELDVESLDEIDFDDFMLHCHSVDECPFDFVLDNSESPKLNSALRFLIKENTLDEKIHFADTIRKSMSSYYLPRMQKMIDERISGVEAYDFVDSGLSRGQHKDNGEIYYY